MEYLDMEKDELLIVLKDKDKEIDQLESDCNVKDKEIEKLEVIVSDLEYELEDFKDLTMTGEVIRQINLLTTDEVAKIYYAIQESYHFQHIDKFKPL